MIGVLLRADPAVRTLPPLALCGGALGALTTVAVGRILEKDSEVWSSVSATLAIAPLIHVLMVSWVTAVGGWAGVRDRAGELHLTLPVPLHAVVGARMLALLLVGWLPLAIVAAAMLVGVRVPEARAAMLRAAGASALVWAAWVAACFAWKPTRPRLDSLPAFLTISGAGLGLACAALLAPTFVAPVALLLLVVAGFRAWRGIPTVMEMRAAEAARPHAGWQAQSAPMRSATRSLRGLIARRTCLLGRNIVLLVAIALSTFVMVGEDGPLRSELVFATFFTGMVIVHSTRVLRDVAHLPIARARLAAWVLLPPLLALLLGFVGSFVAQAADPGPHWSQQVDLVRRRGSNEDGSSPGLRVVVPGALLRPVLGPALGVGSVVVTAPSGESAALEPEPLIPGLPLAFANPYDIGPESSIEFVAWQLSRAVRDAYGVEIEPRELRERYLSERRGRVRGTDFDGRFLEDHPQVESVPRSGVVGWAAAQIVLLWLLAGWWGTRANVPAADRSGWERERRRTIALQLAGGLAFVGLIFGSTQWHRRLPGVEDSLAAALVRTVGGSEWVLPAITLVVAVAGYAWLVRRFERMETPPALRRTLMQAPE